MVDDEPALLMAKYERDHSKLMLLDEKDLRPHLMLENKGVQPYFKVWYLNNGASNHMSSQISKLCMLDEGITGRVRFGDGSTVEIKRRGSVMLKCKDWEERVLHEASNSSLDGVTPYEAWSGSKPDIGHIRVFGCKAHMKVPSQGVKKLDDRSVCVVNLGKEPGSKAYRLYNPVERQVYVSKDVVFEVDKSWPWEDLGEDSVSHEIFFDDVEPSSNQEDGTFFGESTLPEDEEQTPGTPLTNVTESRLNPEDYDDRK
ncbi:hypothetical protein AgCh_016844 [Apium graveolens]